MEIIKRPNEWDQLPGEPDRDYKAFLMYRDLPENDRSAEAVWRLWSGKTTCPSGWVLRACQLYKWVIRVQAWERAFQVKVSEDTAEIRRQIELRMHKAHLNLAKKVEEATECNDPASLEKMKYWMATMNGLRKGDVINSLATMHTALFGEKHKIESKEEKRHVFEFHQF